ncbi:MAG: histidinol-phosphatase HisJ family protein [Hespellia sp.]|nr:histidinol-phosphatase HisJ family protein [Hespellia sp.]
MNKTAYRADSHVHTYYSDDSECPMEDMILKALECQLDEITFTEHVDYGVKTVTNCDYEAYLAEAGQLKEKYKDKIIIRTGIEFGVQTHTKESFQRDFEAYPFDFVLLSNHQIDNKEFWDYEYQEGRSQEEYQENYYKAIYDVMQVYKSYSVLAHLDMIKRYDQAGDFPDEKVMRYVDPILQQVIADGRGIEINTSSFKYGLKDLMPSRKILRRYRELGGEIITLGSDTHETQHLADHMEEVRAELKDMGYQTFCTFEKMQPVFHEL